MKTDKHSFFGFILGVFWLAGVSFGQAVPTPAEDHAKKMKEIEQMVTLSGVLENQKQLIPMMIATFRKGFPNAPQAFWSKFEQEMMGDLPNLNQKLFAIYDQHFTQSEIETYISFYQTPAGQKLAKELPLVTQEGYKVGSQWGMTLGEKVEEELKKEGYE